MMSNDHEYGWREKNVVAAVLPRQHFSSVQAHGDLADHEGGPQIPDVVGAQLPEADEAWGV